MNVDVGISVNSYFMFCFEPEIKIHYKQKLSHTLDLFPDYCFEQRKLC